MLNKLHLQIPETSDEIKSLHQITHATPIYALWSGMYYKATIYQLFSSNYVRIKFDDGDETTLHYDLTTIRANCLLRRKNDSVICMRCDSLLGNAFAFIAPRSASSIRSNTDIATLFDGDFLQTFSKCIMVPDNTELGVEICFKKCLLLPRIQKLVIYGNNICAAAFRITAKVGRMCEQTKRYLTEKTVKFSAIHEDDLNGHKVIIDTNAELSSEYGFAKLYLCIKAIKPAQREAPMSISQIEFLCEDADLGTFKEEELKDMKRWRAKNGVQLLGAELLNCEEKTEDNVRLMDREMKTSYLVYRFILNRYEYFKTILRWNNKSIQIDVSSATLKNVARYMHDCPLKADSFQNAFETLIAANKYGLYGLFEEASQLLQEPVDNEDNVIGVIMNSLGNKDISVMQYIPYLLELTLTWERPLANSLLLNLIQRVNCDEVEDTKLKLGLVKDVLQMCKANSDYYDAFTK